MWHEIDSIPDFWLSLEPIPAGVHLTTTLIEAGHDVVFCTSPPENPIAWQDKVRWLRHHFVFDSPRLMDIILLPTKVGKESLAKPGNHAY